MYTDFWTDFFCETVLCKTDKEHDVCQQYTATIKAFTLALCGLPLWLLVSMEVSKFDQFHGYPSSVSLRLQMVYPNTWILWFKRQMELMFSSVIFLRTTNRNKWTDLLALVLACTVSILTVISFKSFQRLERNTFAFLLLCISHVLMAKIFRF